MILHLKFDTQYEMCSTFLRFQEFYESPEFQGKVFTHEAFMDWYASQHKDKEMAYFRDWSGFNLPDTAFKKFFAGEFDPLWEKERKLLRLIQDLEPPYYVIGTYGENEALDHEIVHGLYYLYPDYALAVNAVLDQWKASDIIKVRSALSEMHYASSVHFDEINAFTTTGWNKKLPPKKSISYNELNKALVSVARDFFCPKIKSSGSKKDMLNVISQISGSLLTYVDWNNNASCTKFTQQIFDGRAKKYLTKANPNA